MKKVAVIGLNRIGDAVYTLPLIEATGNKYAVDIFTQPHIKDIYVENPFIKNIFNYQKNIFWSSTLKTLKANNYEICIILHNSFKYALLPFLAKIPVRIGYQKELRGWMLTSSITLPKKVIHRMEHNKILGELVGIKTTNILPKIFFSKDELTKTTNILKTHNLIANNYVAFIVGSNAVSRRWSPKNFAKVAEQLIKQYNINICILGAKDDFMLGEKVLSKFTGNKSYIKNLAGKTSLRETMYIFKESIGLITNDTGPMHIASTMGIPVITWFGPTIENEVGPPSKNTIILNSTADFDKGIKDHNTNNALESLTKITPELVLKSFSKIINK